MATTTQIRNFVRTVRIESDTRNFNKYAQKTATINTFKVNNAALSMANNEVNLDLSDYALKSDITTAVTYKGTVASYDALPTDDISTGDMYNITAAGGTDAHGVAIKAGDNVVYNGTGWDNLGGTVDLSGKVDKVEGKQLSTEDYTTEEKALLGSLSTAMDTDFTADDLTFVFTDLTD